MLKKIFSAVVMLTLLFLVGCEEAAPASDSGADDEHVVSEDTNDVYNESEDNQETEIATQDGAYTLGDTFRFGGSSGYMEVTFGTDIRFTVSDNEFSDLYGESVMMIPVTVTNVGDETGNINMFDVREFGTAGTELDGAFMSFEFDSPYDGKDVREQGQLRPGATMDSYWFMLFDGDGEYTIVFDDWFNTTEVVFHVSK